MAIETTREELYRQLWTRPAMQVAVDYGISNVALKKLCRKHRVPVPGRGYWAKKAAGKPVDPPPALVDVDAVGTIVIRGNRAAELPETVRKAQERARERECRPENRVVVDAAPKNLHPAVAATWGALDSTEPCEIGLVAVFGPEVFAVDVARESVPRAMIFLNALATAAEARGYRVEPESDALAFLVGGQAVSVKLLEEVTQTPHVPSAAEERALRVWEGQQRRTTHSWETHVEVPRPEIPEFDFAATGQLHVVLAEGYPGCCGLRRVFGDGKVQRIENLINAILEGLAVWAPTVKRPGPVGGRR